MCTYEIVQDEDRQWTVVAYWPDRPGFEAWGWYDTPQEALESITTHADNDGVRH